MVVERLRVGFFRRIIVVVVIVVTAAAGLLVVGLLIALQICKFHLVGFCWFLKGVEF